MQVTQQCADLQQLEYDRDLLEERCGEGVAGLERLEEMLEAAQAEAADLQQRLTLAQVQQPAHPCGIEDESKLQQQLQQQQQGGYAAT